MEVGVGYCVAIQAVQTHCAVTGATRLATATRRRAQLGVPEKDRQMNRQK